MKAAAGVFFAEARVWRDERHRTLTKFLARFLGAVALLLLLAAGISGWHIEVYHGYTAQGLARAAFLAAAVIVGLLAISLAPRKPFGQPASDPVFQPGDGWLVSLQDKAWRRFAEDAGAVVSFIYLVTTPARFRSRVVETVDLDGHALRQRVTVEFSLSDQAMKSDVMYLPVLQPRKGTLVDKFRLTSGSEDSLTNLSFEETTELAAVGLRTLLLQALQPRPTRFNKNYRLPPAVTERELRLLKIIAQRGILSAEAVEREVESELACLPWLQDAALKDLIRAYLVSLGIAFPIVAVVPRDLIVGERLILKYEQTMWADHTTMGWPGKLRTMLGLQPHLVGIPVLLALTAGSYHLRINAPTAMYLYDQNLYCGSCEKRLERAWRGVDSDDGCHHTSISSQSNECHYHLRRRRGQSYLHLYMRGYGYSRPHLRNLWISAHFKEVPPGTRGTAAATALVETLVIWIAGFLISRDEGVSTDLPVFLLGLPAVLASWAGFTSDSGSVVGSSLLARLSLLVSGLISLAGVAVYLVGAPYLNPAAAAHSSIQHHISRHLTVAGVASPVWVILLLASAGNSLYILWRLVRKANLYSRFLSRPGPVGGWHHPGQQG